jgi:D-cysteine desulfhydrase
VNTQSPAAFARVGKLRLAHLPTPLERYPQLDALVGSEVWIKRDDATGGAEAGNKLRKLEYLLAEALQRGARAVVTCGGLQSNHARATAIAARRLGLKPILMLRSSEPNPGPDVGNVLIDRLLGAEIQLITPAQYAQRDQLMSALAAAHNEPTYVIAEGGSTGLGALGYIEAMAELRDQLTADPTLPQSFDAVVHACGSGGTAAGVQLGARHFGVAPQVIAMAVCDDAAYFEARIAEIIAAAAPYLAQPLPPAELRVVDAYKGPAYGVPSAEQIAFIRAVAEATGIMLDPVYTGKALFGLAQLPQKPRRALFLHTGGLPGLLAEARRFD